MLASLVGALIVILASPMIQLSSGVFTFGFLIPSRSALRSSAASGTSGRRLQAGLAISMVQSSFTKMQTDFSWFPQYGPTRAFRSW